MESLPPSVYYPDTENQAVILHVNIFTLFGYAGKLKGVLNCNPITMNNKPAHNTQTVVCNRNTYIKLLFTVVSITPVLNRNMLCGGVISPIHIKQFRTPAILARTPTHQILDGRRMCLRRNAVFMRAGNLEHCN